MPESFSADRYREIDHLACLLVRHRRCGNPPIERLWAGCRLAKANENPAPVSLLLSGNRLSINLRLNNRIRGDHSVSALLFGQVETGIGGENQRVRLRRIFRITGDPSAQRKST